MVDPLSMAGLAYPVVRDLLTLGRQMKKIYKKVRHAKPDFKRMSDRTKIVAGTYGFFKETMKGVQQFEKLSTMFAQHGDLIKKVEDESQKIVDRLRSIKKKFGFLLGRKPANLVDQCIAHWLWYNESKEIVPALFQDMEVLENSMTTIGILVNTHILLQDYEASRSQELSAQISSFQLMLKVGFQRLTQAQRGLPPTQSVSVRAFAQEVLQLLREEIPQLQIDRPVLNSPATVVFRAPASFEDQVVVGRDTAPSIPPHNSDRDQVFEVEPEVQSEIEPEVEVESTLRQTIRRRGTQSEPPQHISPLLSCSSFELRGQKENQGQGMQGAYMQMPPFGPPKFGPRPKAGRTSTGLSTSSGSRIHRQGDNTQRQS